MLNMYMADDEKLVIETLQSIIDWREHGIQLVGTATNGKVAYEQMMALDVDIVITDIRMPGMTGLEVIERVKAQKPNMIFIVCSGYSDFSYAREAMKYGTVYYLTKPVEIEELLDAVNIAVAKCHEAKLLSGDQLSMLQAEKRITEALIYGQYHKECDYESFFVASTVVDQMSEYLTVMDNLMSEMIPPDSAAVHRLYHQNEIILLFIGSIDQKAVLTVLLNSTRLLKERLNLDLCWGVGGNRPDEDNIHQSYMQSKQAYRHALFVDEQVISIRDVTYAEKSKITIDYAPIIDGVSAPERFDQAKDCVEAFIEQALASKLSPDSLIYRCTEIINGVTNHFKELYSIPPEELYQHNYASIKQLNEAVCAREMGAITVDSLDNMVSLMNERMQDYKDKIIKQIKEFVHSNIHLSISAADIAKVINFNPSYISNFFKKKTGVTLSDYITETKMEKAKSLLVNTLLKVNKIAEEVGYEDQRYFCLVFKKYCGVTPTKFRDKRLSGHARGSSVQDDKDAASS